MRESPPFAHHDHRKRKPDGAERPSFRDTRASLWIAAALAIAAVVVLVTMNQVNLRNDGAPFLIVPPSPIALPTDSGA